jgi:AcrR family transcriptional regulator
VTPGNGTGEVRRQRWGTASALLDDDEARRRLVAAAVRCMVRRQTAGIRIEEVAAEAGVSRATVYRYFRTREDLVVGVLLSRVDAGMDGVVRSLRAPGDAARSIPDLLLTAIGLTYGDEVNEALFSSDSRQLVMAVEMTEPIVDGLHRHLAPLLARWQADGQLHGDLDIRETVAWMNEVALTLMSPPWDALSTQRKRRFIDRYLVRALVPDRGRFG